MRTLEGLPDDDFRRGVPRFHEGNLATNVARVDRLSAIARELGCTTAQLALAWLLAQGKDIVPIPGTKRRPYVEENAAAADLALPPAMVKRIEEAFPKGSAAGDRYSPESFALVDR